MYNPNRVKTRLGVIRYSLSVNSFEKSTGKITSHLQKRYKSFWNTTGTTFLSEKERTGQHCKDHAGHIGGQRCGN